MAKRYSQLINPHPDSTFYYYHSCYNHLKISQVFNLYLIVASVK
ncbi:MAG: hypothetical protein ACP5QK_01780 [Myxococcota bacterium]